MESFAVQKSIKFSFYTLKRTFEILSIDSQVDEYKNLVHNKKKHNDSTLGNLLLFSVSKFVQIVCLLAIITGTIVVNKLKLISCAFSDWLSGEGLSFFSTYQLSTVRQSKLQPKILKNDGII